MNPSCVLASLRPARPLRKPTTSPIASPVSAMNLTANFEGDVQRAEQEDDKGSLFSHDPSQLPGGATQVKKAQTCNYCSMPGHFRCKRCKTTYCSTACQAEDWEVHKYDCRSSDTDVVKKKPKEAIFSSVMGDLVGQPLYKVGHESHHQKIFVSHLANSEITSGTDIQASVLEFYNPSRFFIFLENPGMIEILQTITKEMQKMYSGCCQLVPHVPSLGEVCAVQFSRDVQWYRGLVQKISFNQETANILYIDFGNEEDVPFDRIQPLGANIPLFAPCALECRISGVVPVSDSWSELCNTVVRQMVTGAKLTICVVDSDEGGRTYSVDVTLLTGNHLSTFLIHHGYGSEAKIETKTDRDGRETTSTLQDIYQKDASPCATLANVLHFQTEIDENKWAIPPKPQPLAAGDSFQVVVSYIKSPNKIFVQRVENTGAIETLQLNLKEYCRKLASNKNFRPAPGTACCAQFPDDNQWYRAKVLAYTSMERIRILFLDFGNSEEVDQGRLRPISSSLLGLAMQAFPVSLAVKPIGESWTREVLLALVKRVENRILRIDILRQYENKAFVVMVDEASQTCADIAEMLLSAVYASPVTLQQFNSSNRQQANIPTGVPQELSPCTKPLLWSYTEIPSNGQRVALLASVMEDPGEFYCCVNNPVELQQLKELRAELKKHCEADTSFTPKVGEPCCARFPADGTWQRAMITALNENKAMVCFVDSGHKAKVARLTLRPITPQLLNLPFQAIRCWLAGVDVIASQCSSDFLKLFKSLVHDQNLFGRVTAVTEAGYGLELESGGRIITQDLVVEQLTKDSCKSKSPLGAIPKDKFGAKNGEEEEKAPESHLTQLASVPYFPVEWTTLELRDCDATQPRIAAVVSPSLFYVLRRAKADAAELDLVMTELSTYCNSYLRSGPSSSSHIPSTPVAGSVCCAQFFDSIWYRAVVLEVGESEITVVCADYGNIEKVPSSKILPITQHLLEFPFRIARCALTGVEYFPEVWPLKVLQLFRELLWCGVEGAAQSFSGSTNVLSLQLPAEMGGDDLTNILLLALQSHLSHPTSPDSTPKDENNDIQPQSVVKSTNDVNSPTPITGSTVSPEQAHNILEVSVRTAVPQTSCNHCASLQAKLDYLEHLLEVQLSLLKQLVP